MKIVGCDLHTRYQQIIGCFSQRITGCPIRARFARVGLLTDPTRSLRSIDNTPTPPKEGGMGHPAALARESLGRAGFGFGGFFFAIPRSRCRLQ